MTTTGENIKRIRKKLGMNQEEFGELMDVQKCTVSAWECDKMLPSYSRLDTMAKLGKTKIKKICPNYSKKLYDKNSSYNAEFTRRYGGVNKRAFFEAMACIKALKAGYGEFKDGFTVAKKGKEIEFNSIINDTLSQNNAF